ncbi:MAG: GlsB/YeaQ/YmgE family stress response membrane protein [Gemmatimonadaceae bacterium]
MLRAIIAGLIVGALAKFVMPGKDPGGIIITILLGIGGALLGTFLGRSLGMYTANQGAGIIMSVLGSIVILAIYRAMRRRTVRP